MSRRGTGHTLIQDAVLKNSELGMRSDLMTTQYYFDKPLRINLGCREDWSDKQTIGKIQNHLTWFTDGSLVNNQAGGGIYSTSPKTNLTISLEKYIHQINVCSNANPLHYYVLRVPRKVDRWH